MVVFDFDKTLTYKDTLLQFYLFCSGYSFLNPKVWIYFFFMVLHKLKVISNDTLKTAGIFLFLKGRSKNEINEKGEAYAETIKLTSVYRDYFLKEADPVVISASFEEYIGWVFKDYKILGAKLAFDKNEKVTGLAYNCYSVQKVKRLHELGIEKIERLYTDSFSDRPLMNISNHIYMVKGAEVKLL